MATELPRILIVDDNEDNRYTLQLLLETDGHERIASAANGSEAIALIEKEKFSLVLLDMNDAGFERGRGSQSDQERSRQARYSRRHDQRRHVSRRDAVMLRPPPSV